MRYTLLLILTWYSLVDCKPLHDNQAVESIIRNSMSETVKEKADAIDNLLRLLSEIDLPSICDALSAQKAGGNDKMATVDAILAEAAKSQAMTFIPTNFPETSEVTRPGVAPAGVATRRRQFQDGKQASQEVAISRSEGKLEDLSLDVAAALTAKEQLRQKPTKPNNVDISISALSGLKKSMFPLAKFPERQASSSIPTPSESTGVPSITTMAPLRTTNAPLRTTNAPPKTTMTPPKTTMTPPKTTMTPPKTTRTPPRTTPAPPKTTRTPSTTTIVTKATKKDTTIPTLASDMMLPDSLFGESGDGENLIEKIRPTETITTLKMNDVSAENKIYNPFEKKYKKIFQNRKAKEYELKKDSPYTLPKSTSSPEPKDSKTSKVAEVQSSVYKTFVPDSTNTLSEQTTDMIDITPTVEDDLGWGFTLPQNTTFGEFMFGNLTLNQTLSDELASILNSTISVDFLISNDTIYNEFMRILNETLATDESDSYLQTQEPEFDMGLSETGDMKNLIDYISNITEKLSTLSPEVNGTTVSPMNSTTMVELVTADLDNSTNIVDRNEPVINVTHIADNNTVVINASHNVNNNKVDINATHNVDNNKVDINATHNVNNNKVDINATHNVKNNKVDINATHNVNNNKVDINATHNVDNDTVVLNSTLKADYSTYSAKVQRTSNTETSSSNLKATFPSQNDYIHTKFPEYPPRREDADEEIKSQTMSRPTAFTAGDYYLQPEQEDVDMIAGSNNFIHHEDIKSQFKNSGFAPLNKNHDYKVNAKHAGLTYLGFDFKKSHKSPYVPKTLHDEGAVQSLTKQKTIWSEPIKKDVTFPTGYTCPGLFGYFGDAHDCKAFFICSWGVPYRFHCPPGTIWSTEESVCNWSRDVTCQESS